MRLMLDTVSLVIASPARVSVVTRRTTWVTSFPSSTWPRISVCVLASVSLKSGMRSGPVHVRREKGHVLQLLLEPVIDLS
jgi:hypothetical protein